LCKQGIELHPDSLAIEQLRQRAWEVVAPEYRERLTALAGEFMEARSKGLGADQPGPIAEAATSGRVGTLLVEAERRIPGRLEAGGGVAGQDDPIHPDHPGASDLLDDLAELVLKTGGEVVVVPAPDMPVTTGAAAIFRY
jgi:hypothetical protein